VPGYVTIAAIYPTSDGIGWSERFALSLVLSLIIIPLLALVTNVVGISFWFSLVVLEVASYVAVVWMIAYLRRMRESPERRLSGTVEFAWPRGDEYSSLDKSITLALALSVIVAAGLLAYVAAPPNSSERFTEFYILGSNGKASGYPSQLKISEIGSVIIDVVNHEYGSLDYTIRVDLVGIGLIYNASTGSNQTVELSRTAWSWFNLSLAHGQRWTRQYSFSIPVAGLWKVGFALFRGRDFLAPYRELHLYVKVS
jgi:uncharacterized membrane protein